MKSIFDSNIEKNIYKSLRTRWNKYVDLYPQIPIKNVLGFEDIKKLTISEKAKNYLFKTSFDFVVCELNTGKPILAIEFDGISGGFSRDGKFYVKSVPPNDQYRKLKMETKLTVCESLQFPIVVVSYQECELLKESEEMITILDIIIGDAIEKKEFLGNYSQYSQMISAAYEYGGKESAELKSIEIDIINERSNPIKRKIKEITKNFPFWPTQIVFPQIQDDKISGRFNLNFGILTKDNMIYTKKLLYVDIFIRKVNTCVSDDLFQFNTIGEYCLAKKTQKVLGNNIDNWKKIVENTEWTK